MDEHTFTILSQVSQNVHQVLEIPIFFFGKSKETSSKNIRIELKYKVHCADPDIMLCQILFASLQFLDEE